MMESQEKKVRSRSKKVGLGDALTVESSSLKSPSSTPVSDLDKARLIAYKAEIERLKAENLNLKRTVKHMERRIMRSDHQSD